MRTDCIRASTTATGDRRACGEYSDISSSEYNIALNKITILSTMCLSVSVAAAHRWRGRPARDGEPPVERTIPIIRTTTSASPTPCRMWWRSSRRSAAASGATGTMRTVGFREVNSQAPGTSGHSPWPPPRTHVIVLFLCCFCLVCRKCC